MYGDEDDFHNQFKVQGARFKVKQLRTLNVEL